MRPLHAVLVALVTIALIVPSGGAGAADLSTPGIPRYANRLLVDFVTPTLVPGQSATFSFDVNNSYPSLDNIMTNVTVLASIYKYATEDEALNVTDSFQHAPLIDGQSVEGVREIQSIAPGAKALVSFDIETSGKTPHGTYFSPASYFVRISLSFYFAGNATQVVLKSKGYFTNEQWSNIVALQNGNNATLLQEYMKSIGVDGLIPDSAFGMKQPIPWWPLVILVAACVAVSMLVVYYFVLDNPGRFPKLEKRFYYLRGKLSESRRKFEDRRRK